MSSAKANGHVVGSIRQTRERGTGFGAGPAGLIEAINGFIGGKRQPEAYSSAVLK